MRHADMHDFVYCWAGEGIGSAIMLEGRLRRGATGGAGEIGFMPGAGRQPGAPGHPRPTPVGSTSWQVGTPSCAWLAAVAWWGRTAKAVVAAAAAAPASDGGLLDQLADPFTQPASLPWSASSTRHWWCWPAPCCCAGGESATGPVSRASWGELAMVSPMLVVSSLDGRPRLRGRPARRTGPGPQPRLLVRLVRRSAPSRVPHVPRSTPSRLTRRKPVRHHSRDLPS